MCLLLCQYLGVSMTLVAVFSLLYKGLSLGMNVDW